MKKTYFILCFVVLMIGAQVNVFGQILAWDFYGNTSQAATYNSTYNDSNVDASVLTRGAGAGAGGGYSYGFSVRYVEAANSYETAKTANAYLEFKVKSSTAYISLEGIDVKLRSHSAGATNYRWAYKKPDDVDFIPLGTGDGVFPPYDDTTPAITDAGITQPTLNLATVTALQNIPANTEVTFRLYGWGGIGTGSTNTSAIGKSGSSAGSISLMLRGVTTASPVTLSTDGQIASWQWSTLGASSTAAIASPVSATEYNANLSSYTLSRGDGLTAAAYQRALVSTLGTSSVSLSNAEAANEYYQIALSANTGYYTTLSSLLYRLRRTNSGPTNYQWKYSITGEEEENFANIGTAGTFPAASPAGDGVDMYLDLQGIEELKNVPAANSIILRLYVWGNTTTVGGFGFGRFNHATTQFNSIYIKGAVTESPLPVTLTSFTAQKQLNGVKLNWQTASEENNSHFEVYRSGNGKPSELLGTVKGSGTSSSANTYSFTDNAPLTGVNYYQLRQVDADGKYSESAIVSVNTALQVNALKVYTNGTEVKVHATQTEAGRGTLQITDISGRSIYKQTVNLQAGENILNVPFNGNGGVYVVSLISDKGEYLSTKFIK